jgi:hypothetical protein
VFNHARLLAKKNGVLAVLCSRLPWPGTKKREAFLALFFGSATAAADASSH